MVEFKELMEKRNEKYKNGKWDESIFWADEAAREAEQAGDLENFILALNAKAWGERYVGFKTDDSWKRKVYYQMAQRDWMQVLELQPKNIDVMISAIKGLMLLPDEDIEDLCELGKAEIEKKVSGEQKRDNLKGELVNSAAIVLRETDPERAAKMGLEAYLKVEKGTVIAGHLANGIGVCHLIMKNRTRDKTEKRSHAIAAIDFLTIALSEYPLDAMEHRRAAQEKIDNTRRQIDSDFE